MKEAVKIKVELSGSEEEVEKAKPIIDNYVKIRDELIEEMDKYKRNNIPISRFQHPTSPRRHLKFTSIRAGLNLIDRVDQAAWWVGYGRRWGIDGDKISALAFGNMVETAEIFGRWGLPLGAKSIPEKGGK